MSPLMNESHKNTENNSGILFFDGKPCILSSGVYNFGGGPAPISDYLSSVTFNIGLIGTEAISAIKDAIETQRNVWSNEGFSFDTMRGLILDLYTRYCHTERNGGISNHISISLGTSNPNIICPYEPDSNIGANLVRINFTWKFYEDWCQAKISEHHFNQIRSAVFENLNLLLQLITYDSKYKRVNNNLVDQDGNMLIEFGYSYFERIEREHIETIFEEIFQPLIDRGLMSDVTDEVNAAEISCMAGQCEPDNNTLSDQLYIKFLWDKRQI